MSITSPQGACLLAPVGPKRPDLSLGWGHAADWTAAVELDVQPHRPQPPAPQVEVTARQRQILDYIAGYIDLNGYPPSVREISAAVGMRSANSACYQVGRLVELGLLERPGGGCRSRALRLVRGGAA